MRRLRCCILKHTTAHDSHYDWLMEHPAAADPHNAPLWTVRVDHPPAAWRHLGRLLLTPLPDHRRIYLTYQGSISNHRGHVTRIDQGFALPLQWSTSGSILQLHWQRLPGPITLRLTWLLPPTPQLATIHSTTTKGTASPAPASPASLARRILATVEPAASLQL